MNSTTAIIERIIRTSTASEEELLALLVDERPEELFAAADKIKRERFDNKVILRGIIEFSNHCRCSCAYCGLHCGNRSLQRYRFTPDDIVRYAGEAYAAGYRSMVLQSGEDLHYDTDKLSDIIRRIKQLGEVSVTLSVGERSYEAYKQWHRDGADRYLLKHETSDEALYNSLHPHSSFRRRLECLRQLAEIGYETGSGFMVGLPGQTRESLARDILLLQELRVEMAGIGIYIAHPDTPLADAPAGAATDAIRCIAISRLLMKAIHLPSTTSVEVGSSERYSSLKAGANVIMKKVEPYAYRKLYEIYPNAQIADRSVKEERMDLEAFIASEGLTTDRTTGLSRQMRESPDQGS